MNDKPETTFEFDPLPGDATVTTAQEKTATDPATDPAKKKHGKATKPERKKRGPRRVRASPCEPQPITPLQEAFKASQEEGVKTAVANMYKKPRKKREPKADLAPEFGYIKQFMTMSEPTRKRVLAVLNKVFG